jgi:hypothetical protein
VTEQANASAGKDVRTALLLGITALGCSSIGEAIQVSDLGPQHSLQIIAQRGYLPGIPVVVRVEVTNTDGPERSLWNAEATLSVDDPAVMLSTNRLRLRNGLGSTLVAFREGTDFVLTATVGVLQATRSFVSLADAPVSTIGGTLAGANVWSGLVRVTNDVTVPAGASLTILSNTLVLVDGVTSGTSANDLLISGRIECLGTEAFPITLTANSTNPAVRWGQIRHNTAQPSFYRYTSITRAGRAAGEGHTGTAPVIRPVNSTLRFEHCSLTDHAEPTRGATGFGTPGKIAQASGSDLTFTDCLFQRARMGPEVAGTALACTNTWIMDMAGSDDADGIYVHDQSAGQQVNFRGCVIARGDDDGIDTLGSTLTVTDCIIRDWDNLLEDAKGLSVFNGATHLRRCLIVDCTVGVAAKWSSGAATLVTLDHCTLSGNLTNAWANWKANAPGPFIDYRITNSVLWDGQAIQSDFGPTNFTLGYCCLSEPWPGDGNLVADPLFVDAAARDFRLQPHSPCIDAGSPTTPWDADGSRADLGWVSFVPPAPILTGAGLAFTLHAYSNRNYAIEVATNLVSGFAAWRTHFQTNSTSLIQAPNQGDQRFFRALWPH